MWEVIWNSTNKSALREMQQTPEENPSTLLERLGLTQFTSWDPEAKGRQLALNTYFITQSALDIQRKFQKLAISPDINLSQLVEIAFKVFNRRCDRK